MVSAPQVFRLRIVLQAMEDLRLHSFHPGILYALIAAATGRSRDSDPALPDGLLLDAPEQCRVRVQKGESYAFGFTLLDRPISAATRIGELLQGLREAGKNKHAAGLALGGNFRVQGVQDIVGDHNWGQGDEPVPLSSSLLADEIEALASSEAVTVRFTSPYRGERPNRDRSRDRGFFDETYFPPEIFARRLWDRLLTLGIVEGPPPPTEGWKLAENRLFWLDFSYGFAASRKRLGGVVGRIVFREVPPAWRRALVWGQYVRAGLNTRFGFGAYRIEELGSERYPCRRAVGLLDLAMTNLAIETKAGEIASGEMSALAERIRQGEYEPPAPLVWTIPKRDGGVRRVSAPPPLDRALQQAVLRTLAPGLDAFFEESSFAYRKGLGRHSAARGLSRAWSEGYLWAARADLHHFFDSIPHAALQDRLDAYVADPPLVELLMAWVRAGAAEPGQGIPVGAPVAPLLANLFLDHFDERIAAEGGRLIRYADDFLILTRTQAEAERLLEAARTEAAALELALNEEKTAIVDLRQPIEFLGFRFERRKRWERTGSPSGVRRVEELGWTDASNYSAPGFFPGETFEPAENDEVLIAGPGTYRVALRGRQLHLGDSGFSVELDQLEALILLDEPEITGPALTALAARDVPVFIADRSLKEVACLLRASASENVAAMTQQIRLADDECLRLPLARALVEAKLRNYAVLALCSSDGPDPCASTLRQLADRAASANSVDELLGFEGSGGRAWYGSLAARLPRPWEFPGRVAPQAEDPVNVLLNLGFTYLFRWAQLSAWAAGLLTSIGFLHRPRSGHAALASDLMEPFRPVIERAVLALLRDLRTDDFHLDERGPFALRLAPRAYQMATSAFARALRRGLAVPPAQEIRSHRRHLLAQARGLARHLADPQKPWTPFRIPEP